MKKYTPLFYSILCLIKNGCGTKEPIPPPSTDSNDLTSTPYKPTALTLKIPSNFPNMDIPADNPLTTEGVELGRRLFYDKLLSANGTLACASCHLPQGNFSDNQATSKGIDGLVGRRSSMTLENVGFVSKGLF